MVFPAASFAEKSGTYTNTERRIQRTHAPFAPKSGMTNLEIIAGLAAGLGSKLATNNSDIWKEIRTALREYSGINETDIEKGTAFCHGHLRCSTTRGFGFPHKLAGFMSRRWKYSEGSSTGYDKDYFNRKKSR